MVACLLCADAGRFKLRGADTTPSYIVGVGSLNGDGVGVCFSEPVDAVTATNPANYTVFSWTAPTFIRSTVAVTRVVLRPDGQSVRLDLARMLDFGYLSYIRVVVTNILDLAGNMVTNPPQYGSGQVRYLFSADITDRASIPPNRGPFLPAGVCWRSPPVGRDWRPTPTASIFCLSE